MTYQYARRPADFLSYNCLDFNEYQGEIPDSPALNPERFRHYPLTDDPALLKTLASWTSFPQENLALTAGADEALFHSLLFLKLRRGFNKGFPFFQPSYDHAACFMKTLGFSVSGPWPEVRNKPTAAPPAPGTQEPLTQEPQKKPPQAAQAQPAQAAPTAQGPSRSVVYLASPNNPTGCEAPPDLLEKLVRKDPRIFWLLDMTYIHYSARFRISDYKSFLLNNKNAALVLSLSKSFPLAGLRIGALASADAELLKYFREEYNRKSVNAAARAAALQCLEKESFYKEQRRQILRNKPLLAAALLKEAARFGWKLKPQKFAGGRPGAFLEEAFLERDFSAGGLSADRRRALAQRATALPADRFPAESGAAHSATGPEDFLSPGPDSAPVSAPFKIQPVKIQPVKVQSAKTQAETGSQALSNLASESGNFFCLAGSAGDLQKFTEHLYSKKIIVRHKEGWDFLRATSVSDSRLQQLTLRIDNS